MKYLPMPKFPSFSLLTKCLIGSFALHSAAIYILVEHPIRMKNNSFSLFVKTRPLSKEIVAQDTTITQALEEFFEEFPLHSKVRDKEPSFAPKQQPVLLESSAEGTLPAFDPLPLLGLHSTPLKALPPAPFSPDEQDSLPLTLLHFPIQNKVVELTSEPNEPSPLDFISADSPFPVIQDKISLDPENKASPTKELLFARQVAPAFSSVEYLLFEEKAPSLATKNFFPFSSETFGKNSLVLHTQPPVSTVLPESSSLFLSPSLTNIDDCIPLQTLFSLQWRNDFSITPSFFPDDGGYVFSLTLSPIKEIEGVSLKQNFYFLVDISSQVEKHKASVFKKSLLKAIATLQPHHSFNVILLGKGVNQFSQHPIPFSLESLHRVEEFLDKEQQRSFFVSFNLLEQVKEAIGSIEKTDELHTALLLSTGKFTSNLFDRQKEIFHILDKSEGKVQLFTAAVGQNNNLFNLDMISSLCGGRLLYSDTNASFPRKLSTFIKSLQTPLLKELSISIQAEDPKVSLELRCPPSHINCLYQNEPLVIMGKIDRLCNLKVGVEGKNEEGFILLQKDVSFEEAQESSPLLKKEWALLETAALYHQFLEDSDEAHLKKAKNLLQAINSKVFRE